MLLKKSLIFDAVVEETIAADDTITNVCLNVTFVSRTV